MLIETIIFAIFMGFVKGGRLRNLRETHLRGAWLVILAFVLQLTIYFMNTQGLQVGPEWLPKVLHMSSYLLLLIFVAANYSLSGVGFVALGVLLNGLVIAVNDGRMPVDPGYLSVASAEALRAGQGLHGLLSESTQLSFLADIIYLDIPGLNKQYLSIGDILIDIGAFMVVFDGMTTRSAEGYSSQYFRQDYSARNWPE